MVGVMHGWMDGSSNLPRDKEVMRFMLTGDERMKKWEKVTFIPLTFPLLTSKVFSSQNLLSPLFPNSISAEENFSFSPYSLSPSKIHSLSFSFSRLHFLQDIFLKNKKERRRRRWGRHSWFLFSHPDTTCYPISSFLTLPLFFLPSLFCSLSQTEFGPNSQLSLPILTIQLFT